MCLLYNISFDLSTPFLNIFWFFWRFMIFFLHFAPKNRHFLQEFDTLLHFWQFLLYFYAFFMHQLCIFVFCAVFTTQICQNPLILLGFSAFFMHFQQHRRNFIHRMHIFCPVLWPISHVKKDIHACFCCIPRFLVKKRIFPWNVCDFNI